MSNIFTAQFFEFYDGAEGTPLVFTSLKNLAEYLTSGEASEDCHIIAEFQIGNKFPITLFILNSHDKETCVDKKDFNGYSFTNDEGLINVFKSSLHKWVEGDPKTFKQGLEMLKC